MIFPFILYRDMKIPSVSHVSLYDKRTKKSDRTTDRKNYATFSMYCDIKWPEMENSS